MKFFFHRRFNKLEVGKKVINKNNIVLNVTRKIIVKNLDSYELTNSKNGNTYCVYSNGTSVIPYLSRNGYDIPVLDNIKKIGN